MYCPVHFKMAPERYEDFITRFPLALLIHPHELCVSHCPLIYLKDSHQLAGHLAKGNPILSAFSDSPELKIVFNGHQGYVSASWYTTDTEVPTWNYSSLEVVGKVVLTSNAQTLEILTRQNEQFEASVNEHWQIEKLPEAKRNAMLNAIQGFTITIDNWQGKAKLSQNKNDKELTSVREHMRKRDYWPYPELLGDIEHG